MLSKLEYWFLDIAAERSVAICDIVPDLQGYLGINRKPLDISLVEMSEILDRLFQEGYLRACEPGRTPGDSTVYGLKTFIPSKNEIIQGLQEASVPEIIEVDDGILVGASSNPFNFFLTPEGGAAWESLSHPKWENYFKEVGTYSGEYEASAYILSVSKELIEKLIHVEDLIDFGGSRHTIIPGTVKWESVSPLKILYWKTFPYGYKVSYRYQFYEAVSEFDSSLDNNNDKSPESIAQKWYDNICFNWYTNYFKI
jgi:hypothetical protein